MIHFASVGFGHNMDQGLSPARKAMQAEQSTGEAGEKANSWKSNHSSWSRAAAQNSLSHFQNTVIKGKQRLYIYLVNCKQTILQFGEQLHVEHSLFNYLEMTSSRQKGRLQIITEEVCLSLCHLQTLEKKQIKPEENIKYRHIKPLTNSCTLWI